MVLLSLDQASKTSGYAIFIDSKLEAFGQFTFDDPNIGNRLVKIRNKIIELINKYKVDEIVYEDIQQQNNVANNIQTFKILAEVYGIVSELCAELQIPHSSTLSTVWKSNLGIKGRTRQEQKRNAQAFVLQKYNIKVNQDTSDAICIGTAYIQQNQCAWD